MTGSDTRMDWSSLKALRAAGGKGPPFPFAVLSCQLGKLVRDLGEVLDVCSEEVAQSQKLSYFANRGWGFGISHGLELVRSRLDAVLGKAKTKVGDIIRSEFAFREIDLDLVKVETVEDLVQGRQHSIVAVGVAQQVVDVHQRVVDASHYCLHESLKTGRSTE